MNLMKYTLLLILFVQALAISAQNDSLNAKTTSLLRDGNIEIICDARIDKLIQKHISLNESKPVIDGYRIQIFFASGTNSRKMATDTKANFMAKYPEIIAHVKHEQPNFKVRVGDFRNKLEATRVLNEIKRDFPGAFIVMDEINLPDI
ncbi:MAG: SPOR domain-containing protein [Bacteroidetes bacterium]|nr:SPOR domain-containing protein [Bacteroidota bacterium]